jgi:MFS family permease
MAAEPPYPKPVYAWYVVGVLTLVYLFSFIDRQILNLLVGPIRRDLHITDTQISLLSGFGFAVFYAFFGLPLGRIADWQSRRGLIASGFVLWSLFCMGCGFARSYFQLMLMRMGIGVGEASLSPAAYSLITDYFPPDRRSMAQAVYGMGTYLGAGLAMILGGFVTGWISGRSDWTIPLIGHIHSWQMVFLAVGAPGLLLVFLMLSVAEPERRGVQHGAAKIPLREVFGFLKRNRVTFMSHNFGFALLYVSAYGNAAWIPTFFIRHHHFTAAHIGKSFGAIQAISGVLGIAFAGWAADYFVRQGHPDACLRVAMVASVLWIPFGIAFPLVADAKLGLALLAPAIFLAAAPVGVAAAAVMAISPPRMRGQTGAIYLFVVNLIGLSAGPTAVALVTDYLFHDDNSVGLSLLLVTSIAHVLAVLIFLLGLKPYVRSQESLQSWTPATTSTAART